MNNNFDYLVLGGGSGGIASARRAAQQGARVAVIESGPLGGTCVNLGCVPKKLMWHAGQLAHGLDEVAGYGFSVGEVAHDWTTLVSRREAYLRRLNGIYQQNLERDGVTIISGHGQFVDAHTVSVAERRIQAEHILIATGGRPDQPDIPGAELGLSSDGFFALSRRPERVVLVGSGYIAVELAGVLQALGSTVQMIVRRDRVLRHFDALMADTLMAHMQGLGIELHCETQVAALHAQEPGLRVQLDTGAELAADALIWAVGRSPNSAGLGLERAGVSVDERGHVLVDEWQTSSQGHIYAVGDVTAGPALTPVAIQAGRRLADRLFGAPPAQKLDTRMLPTVIFSHPPIGTIGLSEAQAREQYGDAVRVYSGRFAALYFALIEHKVFSAVKMVVVGEEERVVGLHCIGPGADEMMQGFAVAMRMGACKRDFDATIAIHPTAAEELVTLR